MLRATIALVACAISVYAPRARAGAHIDPATGLVVSDNTPTPTNAPVFNPRLGVMTPKKDGLLNSDEMVNLGVSVDDEMKMLMRDGQYNEALKRGLAFHDRIKTDLSLMFVLPTWVELGRRYPKAKEALLKIRDHDIREFSEGRGYSDLFREISMINQYMGNENATYEFFKSVRQKDPDLAKQCSCWIGALLVEKEGTPQERFAQMQHGYEFQLTNAQRMAEMNQRVAQEMANRGQRVYHGPIDPAEHLKKSAEEQFVGNSCRLIKELIAASRNAEAEDIRQQALKVINDARIKSAGAEATRPETEGSAPKTH
jgi:hypothetical protein